MAANKLRIIAQNTTIVYLVWATPFHSLPYEEDYKEDGLSRKSCSCKGAEGSIDLYEMIDLILCTTEM